MWRTDYIGHPQVQCGVVFGTWMLASHTFRPKASVCSRNVAIDSAFISPLYRGRVGVNYGVFHMATFCAFTAFFHYYFYLRSAHLVISVVDLYLCWWPFILYCCCGALLVYY